jgi:hypothetical protein
MILAAALLITATAQTQMAASVPSNFSLPAFNTFFEQLINEEALLHLDRQEVTRSKASKGSIKALMTQAADIRSLVQSYQDNSLGQIASDAPKPIADLQVSLEKLKDSLEAQRILDKFTPKHQMKSKDMRDCCDHEAGYLSVLLAAIKIPSFSLKSISDAARYNMSPLLYDKKDGLFFADPADTTSAKVLVDPRMKGKTLRKGDVLLSIQGEDGDWESITTWGDVLEISKDFADDEHAVHVKIRRGKDLKEVAVTAVPSAINAD